MAMGEGRRCPHCGSTETKTFPDGSGTCRNCGLAFRGEGSVGTLLKGEEVEVRAPVTRAKVRLGLLGLVGGFLGLLSVPTSFLIGGALTRLGAGTYIATVLNRPYGALACGGTALLVIAAWYSIWAGFHLWRGFPERVPHGLISSILLIAGSALAGLGLPGIVGIAGGVIALLGSTLIFLSTREKREEPPPPAVEMT